MLLLMFAAALVANETVNAKEMSINWRIFEFILLVFVICVNKIVLRDMQIPIIRLLLSVRAEIAIEYSDMGKALAIVISA